LRAAHRQRSAPKVPWSLQENLPDKEYNPRNRKPPTHAKAHSCKDKAMTVYDRTVAKMQQLPEPLLQEVSDFIDFLLVKQDQTQWELWTHFREALDLAEADLSDYLRNLETYEEGLARGDIRW
jgi:Protein of unknown function (DUF2281)